MCGITGWWKTDYPINKELFNRMRDTLAHRGPDGYDSYFSENGNIALGHRRLSFLDLGKSGIQPICNEDRSIWLTINGEIYNYIELRRILETKNHFFKSDTDSEVVIHAYEEWGNEMIGKLEGMFAFGLWDEKKRKLLIARDKFGIKPLYFFCDNNQFIFASEIKAIIENRNIKREIDFASLSEYFYYRYIPSPKTIFKNISKLEPAHFLEIDSNLKIKKTEYFILKTDNLELPQKTVIKEIDEILRKSVQIHIRSDVPIGSFLSGGYDSTLLVKYFSEFEKGFNTFSIGFDNWEKSEHQFAQIVSNKFKTNHHTKILDNTSLEILNELMYFYDEPIADISIIPTFLVSKQASEFNKAVLSGEGADEFFAGYTWHREYLWHISKSQIKDSKKWGWDLPLNNFDIDSYSKAMAMGEFNHSELQTLLNPNLHQFIPEDLTAFYKKYYDAEIDIPKRFQILDIKCFMGELVLTKVDRASMANSLEVRVPFLNSELCSKMLSLNKNVYFDNKKQKIILREILKKHIPGKILKRKKQGFTGPDKYYMNFEWYERNLKNSKLVEAGIINISAINNYLQNKDHWRLWKISVLEKWFIKWMC
jgi:asparagine synthase (glutamine-hydrolysing)